MDAPTSRRVCGFISQGNSQQILALSRSRHADLSSLSCTIPLCQFIFDKPQFSFSQNAALIHKQSSVICLQNCPPYGRNMHRHGSIRGCWCQLDAWMATVDGHRHGNVAPPSLAVSSVDTGPFLCSLYCFRCAALVHACTGWMSSSSKVLAPWSSLPSHARHDWGA